MTRLETLYDLIEATDAEDIGIDDWGSCFAGVACGNVEFQAQGLFLNDEFVPAFSTAKDHFEGFEALGTFFGLLPREAFYLFASASYDQYGHDSQLDSLATYSMFLTRLGGILQLREANYGHAPRQ